MSSNDLIKKISGKNNVSKSTKKRYIKEYVKPLIEMKWVKEHYVPSSPGRKKEYYLNFGVLGKYIFNYWGLDFSYRTPEEIKESEKRIYRGGKIVNIGPHTFDFKKAILQNRKFYSESKKWREFLKKNNNKNIIENFYSHTFIRTSFLIGNFNNMIGGIEYLINFLEEPMRFCIYCYFKKDIIRLNGIVHRNQKNKNIILKKNRKFEEIIKKIKGQELLNGAENIGKKIIYESKDLHEKYIDNSFIDLIKNDKTVIEI